MQMRKFKFRSLIASTLALTLISACNNSDNSNNAKVSSAKTNVSVSGLSSGAYMALQFHLSFSEDVVGSGLIAGGPYYCAEGNIGTALKNCVSSSADNIDLANLASTISRYQKSGKLASAEHNQHDKLWLLHGTLDTRINSVVADKLATQAKTIFDVSNIQYISDQAFAHVMPTVKAGINCEESTSPFIGNCNYDAAGKMLEHIANIKQAKSKKNNEQLKQNLISFKQAEFAGENADTLGELAYLFVPENCQSGQQCDVHISFHGCNQNDEAIGDQYAMNAGFNAWAETNNLIILYPQTKKSTFMPLNPQACWDWWGYTGEEYANKDGKQIQAVKAMLDNIPAIIAGKNK